MRKHLLLAVVLVPVSFLYSQSDSLLKDFKFRNANYRAIRLQVNSAGQYQSVNYSTGPADVLVSAVQGAAQFQQSKSTDRRLFNLNAWVTPSFQGGRSDNTTDENKVRSFAISHSLDLNNKWFSGNRFTEIGTAVSANYGSNKNVYDPPNIEQKYKNTYGSLALTLGIGNGRLENVTDMQNALWLNKALASEARLKRALTPTELVGLGQTITNANNTRVLDARKRTQFILETIDNYFQQNELINKTDIKYFSNLNDIVFFAFNDFRLSGTEKFIRLKPYIEKFELNQSEQPVDNRNKVEAFNYSTLLTAGINKHVPQNLHHQDDLGIAIELSYHSLDYRERDFVGGNIISELDLESNLKQAGLTGFYHHGIYPNSRTLINFKADTRGGYQDFEGESSFYFLGRLEASWNYFISYRTRLICNLGAQYLHNIHSTSSYYYYLQLLPNNWTVMANVGLEVNL